MPGGEIRAGSSSCSEQGSGRWLPKPSDTLRTFARISNPEIGYKGYPMLWYKMKPFGEMVDFLVPDFISSFIPGDFPRHDVNGIVTPNLKVRYMTLPQVTLSHLKYQCHRVMSGIHYCVF